MFALEVLNARHGDALLLHFGSTTEPGLILCDAGPSGTYGGFLEPRLAELKGERSTDGPLPIDLLMVSHLDDDHLHGVVDLFEDLLEKQDNHEALPWIVRKLWINQFDDILENTDDELRIALGASLLSDRTVGGGLRVEPDVLGVAASVPQGQSVRDGANRLGVEMNGTPFHGLVVATAGAQAVDVGHELVADVVAPSQQQIVALQKEWDKIVRKQTEDAAKNLANAAEFLDNSVYNLSSIVVLVKAQGKTMLLTGDARGDHILESLRSAGLLANEKLHVDLFKLPHHGSIRNVDAAFFETITADHYVISADGRDGNPEVATLQLLTASRPDDGFTIYVTNAIPHADAFFAKEHAGGRKYTSTIRSETSPSIVIRLAP